ncbi:MAG: hypothetical protein D6813_11540 [Calditrichaeota bacterium]|nr:MAG: hypothetical protein D6813_11540 [Calditrichota bacterium]
MPNFSVHLPLVAKFPFGNIVVPEAFPLVAKFLFSNIVVQEAFASFTLLLIVEVETSCALPLQNGNFGARIKRE